MKLRDAGGGGGQRGRDRRKGEREAEKMRNIADKGR